MSPARRPRGQTGVRRGSDRGQTGVRPGSDWGQTGVRLGSDHYWGIRRRRSPLKWARPQYRSRGW
jgi:hypothetical protein